MLDMNLNGSDSDPVAEALSARGVPFFYATGNPGQSRREGYAGRPPLQKPFRQQDLIAIFVRLQGQGSSSPRISRGG